MAIIILIPLCIIFVFVWANKSTDKKKNAFIEKKREKTNLELQQYYTNIVGNIIKQEYNALIDDEKSESEALSELFKKYNMPMRDYFEGEYYKYSVIETTDGLTELIVKKQMAELGYKYSRSKELSHYQKQEKAKKVADKMHKDYWWL